MAELKHQVKSGAKEATLNYLQGKLLSKKENGTDFGHVGHSVSICRLAFINYKR